jgi:hypothetical protein
MVVATAVDTAVMAAMVILGEASGSALAGVGVGVGILGGGVLRIIHIIRTIMGIRTITGNRLFICRNSPRHMTSLLRDDSKPKISTTGIFAHQPRITILM